MYSGRLQTGDICTFAQPPLYVAKYFTLIIPLKKNTACGTHWISQYVQILTVTFYLTTILCSFSCFESPRMLGDAAEGDLLIDIVKKNKIFLCQKRFFLFFSSFSSFSGSLRKKGSTSSTRSPHPSLLRFTKIPPFLSKTLQPVDWISLGALLVKIVLSFGFQIVSILVLPAWAWEDNQWLDYQLQHCL